MGEEAWSSTWGAALPLLCWALAAVPRGSCGPSARHGSARLCSSSVLSSIRTPCLQAASSGGSGGFPGLAAHGIPFWGPRHKGQVPCGHQSRDVELCMGEEGRGFRGSVGGSSTAQSREETLWWRWVLGPSSRNCSEACRSSVSFPGPWWPQAVAAQGQARGAEFSSESELFWIRGRFEWLW